MQRLLKTYNQVIFLFFFCIVNTCLYGQSFNQDLQKIDSANFNVESFAKHHHTFLLPKSNNIIIKYNPFSLFLGSMMYVYQGYFSHQIFADCLFKPSCSNMSKLYIKEFGIIKGIFLTADRLTRCNRIAATDVHQSRINKIDFKIHEYVNMFRFKTRKK